MGWQDRLREAAYTAPDGTRQTFLYENVKQELEKKTSAFDFVDAEGTHIQDQGNKGRRFPLRIFLSGDDYDQEADAFMGLLAQRGSGRLEHPAYGVFEVVPFGKITRRDDLKTAGNQAIFELTFWQTTGLTYPSSDVDPASAVALAVVEFNTAAAESFEETISVDTAAERVEVKAQFTSLIAGAEAALKPLAETVDEVDDTFNEAIRSVNEGIDTLVEDPLTLAFQTLIILQAPARAASLITDKLNAYVALLSDITGRAVVGANQARSNDLSASAAVSALILSATNNTFETRSDALSYADTMLGQFDAYNDWRDGALAAVGEVDDGGSYPQLVEAVSLAAGFLVQISFSLKQERAVVLDRAHSIVDLCFALYGDVDESLDFFIKSNDLTGSEILELPRGREIVYYV